MLSVREISENIEQETLAPWAAKSSQAVRDSEEAADDLRTAFQRDRDRIIHSTPFRKLKHKTQVYLCPGDHYRTRLTHSMEVSQIARTIARALRLNEDLTEAAALGQILGTLLLDMQGSGQLILILDILNIMNRAFVS